MRVGVAMGRLQIGLIYCSEELALPGEKRRLIFVRP